MSGLAVRNVPRPEEADVARLSGMGVATIHEAMGRSGLMKPYMRPVWPGARACGCALTVLAHPGDNWMLHVAAELLRPGDIVVVALSADNTDGLFGELLATSSKARGAGGLVMEAGCRATAEVRAMAVPV